MAPRPVEIALATLVAGLVLVPLAMVIWRAGGLGALGGLGAADYAAIRFSLWQAVLSATISVVLAIPVARALARRQFPLRGALITLLGAPFILPVIVAVLGLLAVFGQSGVVSQLLQAVGLPPLSIYGLHGVVLAHVFFNLPLATRLILQGWLAIPAERFRLAATLNLPPSAMFRLIEGPMLRSVLPGAFVVIFVICLSSFAVALTLGGGPAATTVELAIYQAFRFDFDLAHAATLSLVQLGLAGLAGLLALRMALPTGMGAGLDRVVRRWDRGSAWLDGLCIGVVALFLLLPLSMILAKGVPGLFDLPASIWQAALYSIIVAIVSTALCLAIALPLCGSLGATVGLIGIAISPLVLGTGLFLLVLPFANPFDLALPVTAMVNTLMSLPFVLRALSPAVTELRTDYGRLSQSLGLTGLRWWWRIGVPRLRRPIGFSAGLTAALSMGDLGVITLFADPDRATLPLQMYRLMGAYRMDAAAGAAVLLLGLSLGLFWLFDRGARVNADV